MKILMLESWGRCSNYLLHWCIRFFGSMQYVSDFTGNLREVTTKNYQHI